MRLVPKIFVEPYVETFCERHSFNGAAELSLRDCDPGGLGRNQAADLDIRSTTTINKRIKDIP